MSDNTQLEHTNNLVGRRQRLEAVLQSLYDDYDYKDPNTEYESQQKVQQEQQAQQQEEAKKKKKPGHCEPCRLLTPICVPSPHADVYCGDGVITKEDFKKSHNGIIIDKPGHYRLGDNIKFRPSVRATTAITIAASGVVLDFDRYSIKQANAALDIYGVAVARCVSRVKITGTKGISKLTGFTAAGVRVLGNTEHITIENIIVTHEKAVGLRNADIPKSALEIIDVRITTGIAVGEGNTAGLLFKGTDQRNYVRDLTIKNVVAENCVIGCHVVFTRIGLIEDSLFTLNTYYGLLCGPNWFVPDLNNPAAQAFPVVENIVARRIHGDRNEGPFEVLSNPAETFVFDFLCGLGFYEAQDCSIDGATANDNKSRAYLIAIDHDGSSGMTWANTQANNNISTEDACFGFHMSGSIPFTTGRPFGLFRPFQTNFNASIKNIIGSGNVGARISSGVSFFYCEGISVEDCVAQGQRCTGAAGGAFGFEVGGIVGITGGQADDITFKNCTAQNNGNVGCRRVAGFRITSPSNTVVLDHCIANGNRGGSQSSNGIYIDSPDSPFDQFKGGVGVQRVVLSNNTVNGNGNESAPESAGIFIRRSAVNLPINYVLIDHNVIAHNFGDGILRDAIVDRLVIKYNELINNTRVGVHLKQENPFNAILLRNIAVTNDEANYVGVPAAAIRGAVYPDYGDECCDGLFNWSIAAQ